MNNPVRLSDTFGEVIERLKNPPPPKPCAVCGKLTREEFFGRPLCNPYNERGELVKRCKYIYAEKAVW